MDIRQITEQYAVSPQIEAADMSQLAAAGFVMVINNRPDAEVGPDQSAATMQSAAEAAGLTYVENPVVNGAMSMEMVTAQGAAIAKADGPVLAWCRSGTRSSIVWALAQAGEMPTAEIISRLAQAGYEVPGLDQQIDSVSG